MHARIVVTSSTESGILASVIVSIRKSGVEVEKHHSEDKGDEREMSFDVSATKQELLAIRNNVLKLSGVDGVKVYGLKSAAEGQAAPASPPTEGSVAQRISQAYPNILEIINEHLDTIDKQDAADELHKIGLEVAALRKEKLMPDKVGGDIVDIVEKNVIAELKGIATAEYAKDGFETGLKIIVSEFTKPRVTGGAMALDSLGTLGSSTVKCDFLSGYMEGMVKLVSGSNDIEVTEIRCRNEGHPYCLFEFE
jgi:hypothetical protein